MAALFTLVIIIVINLSVGILLHVDNFAHLGGFSSGFLLGFVFLMRPQFGWVSQKYTSAYSRAGAKPKHKTYQRSLWFLTYPCRCWDDCWACFTSAWSQLKRSLFLVSLHELCTYFKVEL